MEKDVGPGNGNYQPYHWHDNQIHGIALRTADPDRDDWTSDLSIDIDHIVEWVKTEGRARFRVAPATLTFHGVTDLSLGWSHLVSGHQVGIALPWIDRIERELVKDQLVHLDRPYYAWRIVFASPPGGEISFGAWGYSQKLRKEPVLQDEQGLTFVERSTLVEMGRLDSD